MKININTQAVGTSDKSVFENLQQTLQQWMDDRQWTDLQFEHRMILRRAMLAHGFKPLNTEWWHFTLKDEPFPDTYFTFPVKQLSKLTQ